MNWELRRLIKYCLLLGAASHIKLFAFTIESKTDARLSDLTSGANVVVKAGAPTDVEDDAPAFLQSPGRIPILIVPLKSQRSVVRIESPLVGQVLNEERDLKVDEALSEVTLYLTEIHRAMGVRDLVRAKQKLLEVKGKHPNVRFFDFIEASLAFLAGERDQALSLVNSGLAAHPDYTPGLDLKKQLMQGKNP